MSLKNDWTPNDTLKNNNVNDIANATNNNTQHRETKINKDTFVHGLKYNDSKNSLILDSESGEVEIGGVGTSNDVTFNPDGTDLVSDNVSDAIKEINDKINKHGDLSIASDNGVHNFKYDPVTKSLYYFYDGEWLLAEIEGTGDISIAGLTADSIKSGVTIVIRRGDEEITRVTGTFTNDSNAIASDILLGKTAYVSGQKIVGNIPTKTGTITIDSPSVSDNNLVTPTLLDGYYNNAKLSFPKGNLLPANLKTGINLYGVTGTFTNDATAMASDIISGKTAYVNGNKITGTWTDKALAYIVGWFDLRSNGSGYNLKLVIKSFDKSLLNDANIEITQDYMNQAQKIYFLRNANVIIYGWSKMGFVDFPWTGQMNVGNSKFYTMNYNITTNNYIEIRKVSSGGSHPCTALICASTPI